MSTDMMIKEVETTIMDIRTKRQHVMSFTTVAEINYMLVKIVTRVAIEGYGEAACLGGPVGPRKPSKLLR